MKSNVNKVLARLDTWKQRNLKASGVIIVTNTQDAIREDDLIDTAEMIGTWDYELGEDSVLAGTPIDEPGGKYGPYPKLQNDGFIHPDTEKVVGGTHFIQRGASASEGELREIWSRRP